MIQKCSYGKVLEVFFKNPTEIQFIRQIGREIGLAQTSVRNQVNNLKKDRMIIDMETKPFNGLVANRDNDKFRFYKQAYNFSSLFDLKQEIVSSLHPRAILIFGSYSRGEDIEESDIDIIILSKVKKDLSIKKFEKKLSRNINAMIVSDLNKLDEDIRKNVINGWVIYGAIDG
jgi:predicted nucleotidyltransferase